MTATGIAVVVPVLGDEAELARLLPLLRPQRPAEILVVSGRADERAAALCREHACTYLEAAENRGVRLDAGARAAAAPALWFLHADAAPPVDALRAIDAALASGAESGCFRFAFQGPTTWYKRVLEQLVALRIRCGGMVYGDQGIFALRDVYFAVGGFADVEAMVASMIMGEDDQLGIMAKFLVGNKLAASLRIHDWPTFARGSRETATWSRSHGSIPPSSRHHAAASAGNPATCLTRLKRSSSAAATSSPSTTSAAAASPWYAFRPRIAVTSADGSRAGRAARATVRLPPWRRARGRRRP